MEETKMSWKELIENGTIEEVARRNSRLADCADELDTTVSALRSAWRRHAGDLNSLGSILGTDLETPAYDDPDLDETPLTADELGERDIYLRGKGKTIHVPKRTLNLDPQPGERWLIPGDIHFGIQDDRSIALMATCADKVGVDRVILQGDTFDTYGISRHPKSADRIRGGNWTLGDERDCAVDFLAWVESTTKESVSMPGNHEDRLWRLMDENPALDGCLLPRTVFSIPEKIRCTEQNTRVRAGSLVIEHGHNLSGSCTEYGPKRVLSKHPDQTTIYGHSHKVGVHGMTSYDQRDRPRRREAITIGHMSLAQKHIDYAKSDPNWQQAFAFVEFWTRRDGKLGYDIDIVEIHDHEFCYRGMVYSR